MGARGTSARVFLRVWLRMESAIWEAWSSRRRRSSETKSDRRTRSSAMVGETGPPGDRVMGMGDGCGYITGQPINGICSMESFGIRYHSVRFGIVQFVANEGVFRGTLTAGVSAEGASAC